MVATLIKEMTQAEDQVPPSAIQITLFLGDYYRGCPLIIITRVVSKLIFWITVGMTNLINATKNRFSTAIKLHLVIQIRVLISVSRDFLEGFSHIIYIKNINF